MSGLNPPCSTQAKSKKNPASRKRAAAAGGDGLKKPRPVGLQKPRYANEFRALAPENPLRVAFEEAEAKKKAEDTAELQAAVKALKAHDLYKQPAYQQILVDVLARVAKGGPSFDSQKRTHEKIAAGRIRRLMGPDGGKEQLNPGGVRLLLRKKGKVPTTSRWTPDEDAALRRLHAEHTQKWALRAPKWDAIAAAIGTGRTAGAAEKRWAIIKNKNAPAAPLDATEQTSASPSQSSQVEESEFEKWVKTRPWYPLFREARPWYPDEKPSPAKKPKSEK